MTDAKDESALKHYDQTRSQIRSELRAFEGEGPPSADQLWHVAAHEARSAAEWMDDMPVSPDEIETARGDVLRALVALEMAEDAHRRPSELRGDSDAV